MMVERFCILLAGVRVGSVFLSMALRIGATSLRVR